METAAATAEHSSTALPVPTKAMQEWTRCRHYIVRSVAQGHGFDTIEDIEREIEAGRRIFWAHAHGAAITRIDQYNGFRVLTVTHGAGDLSDAEMIAAFMPDLENFARIAECDQVAVEVLPDHASTMATAGFKPLSSTFVKHVIPEDALAGFVPMPDEALEAERSV